MADFSQPPSDPAARVDEFMRLYTQHQRRLYVYLLSLVHNAADADELLQESSYILWKKFDQFEPESNFGSWACRVAYFEVLKYREGVEQQRELTLARARYPPARGMVTAKRRRGTRPSPPSSRRVGL